MGARTKPPPKPAPDVVRERVRGLPARFLPHSVDGLAAEWELRLEGQVFTVRVAERSCSVREGSSEAPEAVISADAATWLAMDDGTLPGIDAFAQRRLQVSGNVDLAVRVQTLFRPHARPHTSGDLSQVELTVDGLKLSCYVAGEGHPLVFLHGLGGTKISWLPILPPLAERFRLIVPDLPGHGESDKPATDYTPRFFARVTRLLMDEAGVDQATLVGNSMGGRVALEAALRSPGRVDRLVLLSAAVPGLRLRSIRTFSRAVPSGFGFIPLPFREWWMQALVRQMFGHPEHMGPEMAAAAGEFNRIYRTPEARLAFFSSLRHLLTERPEVFWGKMRRVKQPALVMFGQSDRIVSPKLGARLADYLPNARMVPLPGVGHIPQVEAAQETLVELQRFLSEPAPPSSAERTAAPSSP